MNRQQLIDQIRQKKNFLCIGLDPDLDKLPKHLPKTVDGVELFCRAIIENTLDLCVSYKLNTAFFEALGWQGMKLFEELVVSFPSTHLIIADAKRGDIGNTSLQYAKAFFDMIPCDALTISPYMGSDSIQPFLTYQDKWAIVLGLTSNEGAKDFELQKLKTDEFLFEQVLKTCSTWGTADNMMFVVGATQGQYFDKIREIVPHHFLLIPGVGTQGGSLNDVCKGLCNSDIGILVNSSREIIYASSQEDFAEKAREKAQNIAKEMAIYV